MGLLIPIGSVAFHEEQLLLWQVSGTGCWSCPVSVSSPELWCDIAESR